MRYLIFIVLLSLSCNLYGQEYDLKEHMRKLENNEPIPYMKDGVYIRDISGVLRPFVGTWVGRYKQYAYVLSIHKKVDYGKGSIKYSFDRLDAQYQVYAQGAHGDWSVVEGTGIGGKYDNYLEPRKYHHPKPYSFVYGGATLERAGLLVLSPAKESRLGIYLVSNPALGAISEPQLFPVYEKSIGAEEYTTLCRVGEPGALLLERPRNYDKSLYDWGVLSPMLKMQKDALFMLEGKSYVPFLDIRLLNKLRYDAGRGLPAVYDGYPKTRYGYATLLEGEGGEGELGERNLAYGLHYMSHVMELKGAREEAIHALNFKQLLHAAMLEHLARELLTDAEVSAMLDAERELYEYDFPHVLKVYAQKRGISLEDLKRHCLADAERLFTAQRLPSISKAKQELKTLLDRGY